MDGEHVTVMPGDVVSARHIDGTERLVTVLVRASGCDRWDKEGEGWVCDDGWTRPIAHVIRHAAPHVATAKAEADRHDDQWIADTNAAIDADIARRKTTAPAP